VLHPPLLDAACLLFGPLRNLELHRLARNRAMSSKPST
jgi:hypothetical protein